MKYDERASQGSKPKIAKKLAVRPASLDGRLAGAGDVRPVFFGSGPVAAASLRLLAQDFDFEAVITKPRPAQHRGEVPVLTAAEELRLPVFTAANNQELDQLFDTKPVSSQLAILIDFGIIVSQKVIDYFPLGVINSHFSILPQWRGADPISFAVLSGQKSTGVSLMLIDKGLDTGKILVQKNLLITSGDTTPSLTAKLVNLSNTLLHRYLPLYLAGKVKPRSQPHPDRATYSRKLAKEDGLIDWNKPAAKIEREVRAYAGWPKSQAKIFGHDVIITKARVAKDATDGDLVLQCQPGWLEIEELTAPSGKTISGAEFLRGYSSGK